MYRLTRNKARQDAICKRMREGKERKRLERIRDLEPRPAIYHPPALRRVVVVIDYDIVPKVDIYRLGDSGRIDSYTVTKNGERMEGAGWSNFCKRLSVHYPRLMSESRFSE